MGRCATFALIDELLAIGGLGGRSWLARLQERDQRVPREHWNWARLHVGPHCGKRSDTEGKSEKSSCLKSEDCEQKVKLCPLAADSETKMELCFQNSHPEAARIRIMQCSYEVRDVKWWGIMLIDPQSLRLSLQPESFQTTKDQKA